PRCRVAAGDGPLIDAHADTNGPTRRPTLTRLLLDLLVHLPVGLPSRAEGPFPRSWCRWEAVGPLPAAATTNSHERGWEGRVRYGRRISRSGNSRRPVRYFCAIIQFCFSGRS